MHFVSDRQKYYDDDDDDGLLRLVFLMYQMFVINGEYPCNYDVLQRFYVSLAYYAIESGGGGDNAVS